MSQFVNATVAHPPFGPRGASFSSIGAAAVACGGWRAARPDRKLLSPWQTQFAASCTVLPSRLMRLFLRSTGNAFES